VAYSNWLARQNRTGGEYNTPNVTVPANINEIRLKLNVLESAFATPDRSITADIEVSMDGAQTWQNVMTVGWVGGTYMPKPGGSVEWVMIASNVTQYTGGLARAHVSVSGNFSWGIQGEILYVAPT